MARKIEKKESQKSESQVEGQPSKKPRKGGENSAVAMWKEFATMELRLSRHRAAEIKFDLAEGHKSFETKSQSEVFCKNTGRHIKKVWAKQGPSLGVILSPPYLMSEVRTLLNLRIGPRKRQKFKSDAPAEMSGEWFEVC